VLDREKACVMFLAEEPRQNLALMLCYGKEVKHGHLKQARHTNFLIVNVSEKCYLIGKRKMFKQILRKCVLGM